MIINTIGSCDKRPVLYTLMKICQTLGDVLVISNDTRLIRLSNTRENCGHYQNTMIAVTHEGLDDFLEEFPYELIDFEYVIIDGHQSADADLTIYVEGLLQDENEVEMLDILEGDYKTIQLYKGKMFNSATLYNLECFEAYSNMQPINQKVAEHVAAIFAEYFDKDLKMITEIAMKQDPDPDTTGKRNMSVKPQVGDVVSNVGGKMSSLFGKKKK